MAQAQISLPTPTISGPKIYTLAIRSGISNENASRLRSLWADLYDGRKTRSVNSVKRDEPAYAAFRDFWNTVDAQTKKSLVETIDARATLGRLVRGGSLFGLAAGSAIGAYASIPVLTALFSNQHMPEALGMALIAVAGMVVTGIALMQSSRSIASNDNSLRILKGA